MRYFIKTAVIFFILTGSFLYAEEQKSDEAGKKRSMQPEHSLDISYTGFDDNWRDSSEIKVKLDNKLFSAGLTGSVNSSLMYERINNPPEPGIPEKLTVICEMLNYQSQDYTGFLMVNSPGNKPFNSMHEVQVITIAGKKLWQDGGDSVRGLVFASNLKMWGYYFPIPFISYTHIQDNLFLSLGVPAIVNWRINPKLTFNFTYFVTLNINTTLIYRPLPFIGIGPEITVKQESYYIADRSDNDEVLYRRYFTAGIKAHGYINSHAGLVISAGYIPYGKYYYSDSFFERDNGIDMEKSLYVKGSFQIYI